MKNEKKAHEKTCHSKDQITGDPHPFKLDFMPFVYRIREDDSHQIIRSGSGIALDHNGHAET